MNLHRRTFLAAAGALTVTPAFADAQSGSKPAMKSKTATFVLVHGGGHGGWCWQRVARPLRALGHEVYTPTLTGLGERSHLMTRDTDLDTHINDVVNVLKYEDLTNVILVGHSYGGMVITGVADRALSRIGHLVFLDAAHPKNGEGLWREDGPQHPARAQGRIVNGVELILWPDTPIISAYGVTKPEDLAWMKDKLTPHPWKSMVQPLRLTNEAAVMRIPRTDIWRPAQGTKLPPDVATKSTRNGQPVWEINTGHDMMVTAPKAVIEIFLEVAKLV